MHIRKFLKKVDIISQREIERAVRKAIEGGRFAGNETLAATVTLELPQRGVSIDIEDGIDLE